MLNRRLLALLFGITLLAPNAFSTPIIYARDLPLSNVNAAVDRSNYAWYDRSDPANPYSTRLVQGDTFSLGGPTDMFRIDSIAVYSVASVGTTSGTAFGSEFSSVSLYTGVVSPYGGLVQRMAGTINADGSNFNANITHTQVNYPGGTTYYLDALENNAPVWKTTFSNLNWMVPGNTPIFFAVDGAPRAFDAATSLTYGLWYNHFTDYTHAGRTGDGTDGSYWIFVPSELAMANGGYMQWQPFETIPVDINVQITGEWVPEPSSIALVGLGGLFLAFRGLKRRRS